MTDKKSPIIAGIACRSKEDREKLLSALRVLVAKRMRQTNNLKLTRYDVALEAVTDYHNRLETLTEN